jgi:Zn-dependent protease
MDPTNIWGWSLLLWRSAGLEVRASWMMLVWMLFDAVNFAHAGLWVLLPFAVAVPFVSMLLHALAHVATARLVGGTAEVTTLSVLNDITRMEIPLSPAKHFAAGAAGPLVSLVLWLSFALIGKQLDSGIGQLACAYVAGTNFMLLVLNLLACAFFDGARIWRALLWPVFGLVRAVRITVWLSYFCSGAMIAWSVYSTNWLLLFMGVICFVTTIHEHRSVRSGYDPVLPAELDGLTAAATRSWFSRWQARRQRRRQERHDREEREEREVLDRLLAKVSEQGLPGLTPAERTQLQRISKRQKERQEAEVR